MQGSIRKSKIEGRRSKVAKLRPWTLDLRTLNSSNYLRGLCTSEPAIPRRGEVKQPRATGNTSQFKVESRKSKVGSGQLRICEVRVGTASRKLKPAARIRNNTPEAGLGIPVGQSRGAPADQQSKVKGRKVKTLDFGPWTFNPKTYAGGMPRTVVREDRRRQCGIQTINGNAR